MCGGSSNDGPGSTSGGRGGGFGGVADSVGGGFGMSSVAGNTAAGVGGAGFGGGNRGSSSNKGGSSNNSNRTPSGLRSIEDAHKGLSIAGPQLSRARDNAYATGLSYGIQALGMMGLPFAGAIAMGVRGIRDYGRSYAERTPAERAFAENGMGASVREGTALSSGLSGISKVKQKAAQQRQAQQAPAKAAASGNVGSGQAGATVIMGADKTRTGAGAGSRAKSSTAVRGFGSGGLKL